jgi:hypothetical protein
VLGVSGDWHSAYVLGSGTGTGTQELKLLTWLGVDWTVVYGWIMHVLDSDSGSDIISYHLVSLTAELG